MRELEAAVVGTATALTERLTENTHIGKLKGHTLYALYHHDP